MGEPNHYRLTIESSSVDFYDFSDSRSEGALADVVSALESYLRRIPAAHWRAIDGARLYIIKDFPGQRPFGGGGFYPPSDIPNWHGRERITGTPDSWLVADEMPLGLVAVKNEKINEGVNKYSYTVLHELAHMIDDTLGLTANVTLSQLQGLSYGRVNRQTRRWVERPSVGEYFAEAYSRYLMHPAAICRVARTQQITVRNEQGNEEQVSVDVPSTMLEGENVSTCSARIRRDLGWLFAGDDPPPRAR